jgi:hypothetical protein
MQESHYIITTNLSIFDASSHSNVSYSCFYSNMELESGEGNRGDEGYEGEGSKMDVALSY